MTVDHDAPYHEPTTAPTKTDEFGHPTEPLARLVFWVNHHGAYTFPPDRETRPDCSFRCDWASCGCELPVLLLPAFASCPDNCPLCSLYVADYTGRSK